MIFFLFDLIILRIFLKDLAVWFFLEMIGFKREFYDKLVFLFNGVIFK